MKLSCPVCGPDSEIRVIETRATAQMVYRTRGCSACKARYVTYEAVIDGGFIPKEIRRRLMAAQQQPQEPHAQ